MVKVLKPEGPSIDTNDNSGEADARAKMVKLVKLAKPACGGAKRVKLLKPNGPEIDSGGK